MDASQPPGEHEPVRADLRGLGGWAAVGILALSFGLAMLAAFALAVGMMTLANRRSQRRGAALPAATATAMPVISAAGEDRPIP